MLLHQATFYKSIGRVAAQVLRVSGWLEIFPGEDSKNCHCNKVFAGERGAAYANPGKEVFSLSPSKEVSIQWCNKVFAGKREQPRQLIQARRCSKYLEICQAWSGGCTDIFLFLKNAFSICFSNFSKFSIMFYSRLTDY